MYYFTPGGVRHAHCRRLSGWRPSSGANSCPVKWALGLALLTTLFAAGAAEAAPQPFETFQEASLVIGQTDFTSTSSTADQNTVPQPTGISLSPTGKMAVASQHGSRVLIWNSIPTTNGQNADVIVGQSTFTGTSSSSSQTHLGTTVYDVKFSSDGSKLLVSDSSNHRVLIWNSIPTSNGAPADVVIGQTSFTDNTSGTSSTKLSNPGGLLITPGGKLLISDLTNNRILIYNSIPTTNGAAADVVIGHTNFTTSTSGVSATALSIPLHMAMTADGKLLVADQGNSRVLIWNSIPTTNGAAADVVVGQPDFTTRSAGTTASQINISSGIAVSPYGELAICDWFNFRILIYNSVPTTSGAPADIVLGQPNFTSNTPDNGSVNARSIFTPFSMAFDSSGRLFVVNRDRHRVLVFSRNNKVPAANNDTATVEEDSSDNAIDVLGNDTDEDGDTLTITESSDPANGSTQGTIDGVISDTGPWNGLVYTPDANYFGEDTFTYTISDGHGGTATATVTVTVTPVDEAPVAHAGPDQYVILSGAKTDVTLDGSGSSDPDGGTLLYSWSIGGTEIATGVSPTVQLSPGKHTVSLIVTDEQNNTSTADTVQIHVASNSDVEVNGRGNLPAEPRRGLHRRFFAFYGLNYGDGRSKGYLSYRDNTAGVAVDGITGVRAVVISGNQAVIYGSATITGGGYSGTHDYVLTVQDLSGGGTADHFKLEMSNGYTVESSIVSGDIKIRALPVLS